MPRTLKQHGGSIASDNVDSLVAKSCSRFVYPTKVRNVMRHVPVHQHSHSISHPQNTQQAGGGAEQSVLNWFYSQFVPYMTSKCTTMHPNDTVTAMQQMWNTEHPNARLSKRAAKQMLNEFVTANRSTTNKDDMNVPLHWINDSVSNSPNNLSTYNMVGGSRSRPCLYDTNYTVHQNDAFDRYRGNSGGSPPLGATVPQSSFKGLYDWFQGRRTLFAPTNTNAVHQNQVQYLSQSGPKDAISIHPLNSHIKAPTPTLHGDTQLAGVFPASPTTNYASYTRQTPMARAGGSRRRHGKRQLSRRGKQKRVGRV